MRFCQSYMQELGKYIGPDLDIPAGDMGVGSREIGYLFGQYKKLYGYQGGVLTGKGVGYGGSLGRREATGYGLIYFMEEMLNDHGLTFKDSTVIVSGSGNVAIYAMEKAQSLGANVVACSDSGGYIYDSKGINIETVKRIKEEKRESLKEYIKEHPHAEYFGDPTEMWTIPCDIALPCATQNEINDESALILLKNGVKAVGEGANMPSTLGAIELFLENNILFGPAKAANAGGVAVSALEMSQNSMRVYWTFTEVDQKLKQIMRDIYQKCVETAAQYGEPGNIVAGANMSSFLTVAQAMLAQGIV